MLGPNAQGEWRAATVELRLVNKQYAVTRGLCWPEATLQEADFPRGILSGDYNWACQQNLQRSSQAASLRTGWEVRHTNIGRLTWPAPRVGKKEAPLSPSRLSDRVQVAG